MTARMYRVLASCAVLAAGCGLYTDSEPAPDEPVATSYVAYKDIPVAEWRHPIDVVFVIDTTPDMAPLHDKLVAQVAKLADVIEREGVAMDLQIMVTTADPADHGALVHAAALHMLSLPSGGYDRSYAGSLADELTALVPTAFTATANEPLDALVATLSSEPAFRHSDAQLLAVIIANQDDGSPDAVDGYVSRMRELAGGRFDPMVALIGRPSFPRLQQFFNRQVEPYDMANIDDSDWSDALLSFQLKTTLGEPCIDATLAEPYECVFSAIDHGRETVLATCDPNLTNGPCYELRPTSSCAESGVEVNVNWLAWPEYGTHVIGQCVANFPGN